MLLCLTLDAIISGKITASDTSGNLGNIGLQALAHTVAGLASDAVGAGDVREEYLHRTPCSAAQAQAARSVQVSGRRHRRLVPCWAAECAPSQTEGP